MSTVLKKETNRISRVVTLAQVLQRIGVKLFVVILIIAIISVHFDENCPA